MKIENLEKAESVLKAFKRNTRSLDKLFELLKEVRDDFECPQNSTITLVIPGSVLGRGENEIVDVPINEGLLKSILSACQEFGWDTDKQLRNQIKQL